MKRRIRYGTFETNSSSLHTLCICKEEEFEAWKRGEILYVGGYGSGKFVQSFSLTDEQKEEAKEEYEYRKEIFWKDWDNLSESEKEKWYSRYAEENDLKDEDYKTYEEWRDDVYLETYVEHYTSESGDKIVIFGKYGYDG